MKLWLGIWKCLSHGGPSLLQTLFLCVFILKYNLFLIYVCIFQHIVIFRKGNIPSDKLRSCFCKWRHVWINDVFVKGAFEKLSKFWVVLQHRLIDLVKHGSHFCLLNFFTFKILLLSKTLSPLVMSLRFLFLLNTKIGGSIKMSFNFGSICKFLSIIVLRSGRVLLQAKVSNKLSVLDIFILFSNSFLRT